MNTPEGDRYEIIEEDEFTSMRRVAAYIGASLSRSPFLTVRFGAPMDPFGNEVSARGESLDNHGRVLDPQRYLWSNGVPVEDRDRGWAYTRGPGKEDHESRKANSATAHLPSYAH